MKHCIFLLCIMFLFGCSPSKVEQLILDHEQNFGGAKTDLSMKIEKLEKIGVITAADSLSIVTAKIDSMKRAFYPKADLDTITNETVLADIEMLIESFDKGVERDPDFYLPRKKHWMKSQSEFMNLDLQLLKFGILKDSICANVFSCTYSIKNPMLNGAKQTIEKQYFVSVDETKILKSDADNLDWLK